MKNQRLVIGLTGRFGAGCTTTGRFFASQLKFTSFSLSAYLDKIAHQKIKNFDKKKYEEKREIKQDLGDTLRKKDPAFLVKGIRKEIEYRRIDKVLIETLRNPAEAEFLREIFKDKFYLLGIDATIEARWDRLKHIYKNNIDGFNKNDRRDAGEGQPLYGQRVKECLEAADILINSEENFYIKKRINRKAVDRYAQKISDYFILIDGEISRKPNEKELYMHHACSLALKSECLRKQVGAVIVKDGYIVAAGCNDVPRGEKNCEKEFMKEKVKCYRRRKKEDFLKEHHYCKNCGTKLESEKYICDNCQYDNSKFPGKLLDLCRSVHAEEAAILQVAKLGSTSLEKATLYTSTFPCMLCCKTIIDSGIKNIVYLESYPMDESLAIPMFKRAGIDVSKYEGVTSTSFYRLFKRHL